MPVTIEMSISESVTAEEGDIPGQTEIQLWADKACQSDESFITSVQFVSKDEIRELNLQWRDRDSATNVLSFPIQTDQPWPEDMTEKPLGDLVLCPGVINEEAQQQNKPVTAHWAHMVVHGMLHLQGYDHIEDEEAEKMESLEIELLQQLGYNNPYQEMTG